jgi:hypothetical protein
MNASETPTHRLVSHGVISAVCKLEFTCVTSTIAACLSARAASHGKLADGDAPCLRDAFRMDEIQTFRLKGGTHMHENHGMAHPNHGASSITRAPAQRHMRAMDSSSRVGGT